MGIVVEASGEVCGARVRGIDLAAPLDAATVAGIRSAWLQHHVLSFPDQDLTDDDLERFTQYFGPFGDDPFIAPVAGREHVIAIRRRADETSPLFAENWHSDWSFQATPPAGTCLYGITIPPVGGDTLFADQHAALDAMPAELRSRVEGRVAVHSARGGYAPSGLYGDVDRGTGRSMDIRSGESAMATQRHPLVRAHPETGRPGIFGCIGYIIAIEGLGDDEARDLLHELLRWQTRDEFVHRHRWSAGTLVMWDNRSVLHRATGGYDGHERLLHRTTIGAHVEPRDVSTSAGAANLDGRRRVLCVEDNAVNARLLQKVLNSRPDLRFDWVQSGEQALVAAAESTPALVIMDINLPGIDGYQTLARLRSVHDGHRFPIVAATSNAMLGDADAGLDAGFDAYVTKPIDVVEFLALTDRMVPPASTDGSPA